MAFTTKDDLRQTTGIEEESTAGSLLPMLIWGLVLIVLSMAGVMIFV